MKKLIAKFLSKKIILVALEMIIDKAEKKGSEKLKRTIKESKEAFSEIKEALNDCVVTEKEIIKSSKEITEAVFSIYAFFKGKELIIKANKKDVNNASGENK